MRRGAGEGATGSVRAVDTRTGRLVSVSLEDALLRIASPDRTSDLGVSVTEFPLDELVLAGPVSGRVGAHRAVWAITRAVEIDDPQWGACAPAWSWLLAADEHEESGRSGQRFLAELRAALPKERWMRSVKLSKVARRDPGAAEAELLELAMRRDPAFAARCDEVADARVQRAAGFADRAEQILVDALVWRSSDGVTTVTS